MGIERKTGICSTTKCSSSQCSITCKLIITRSSHQSSVIRTHENWKYTPSYRWITHIHHLTSGSRQYLRWTSETVMWQPVWGGDSEGSISQSDRSRSTELRRRYRHAGLGRWNRIIDHLARIWRAFDDLSELVRHCLKCPEIDVLIKWIGKLFLQNNHT